MAHAPSKMLDQQSSVAPFPGDGRFDGLVQSIALLVVMAAAGLFAVLVFTRDQPTVAQEPPASSGRSDTVTTSTTTLTTNAHARLLILVESAERADTMRLWRHTHPILDAHSFAGVEVSGPIPNAALREALVFANVACVQEGCATVSVLDLRAANPD